MGCTAGCVWKLQAKKLKYAGYRKWKRSKKIADSGGKAGSPEASGDGGGRLVEELVICVVLVVWC